MAFYYLLNESKPDAGAFFIVVFFVEPFEDAENLLKEFLLDADAVIAHVKYLFFAADARFDFVQIADFDGFLFIFVIFEIVLFALSVNQFKNV